MDEWRTKLSPEQYEVMRENGTEPAFSGKLLKEDRDGVFRCAGCGAALFASRAKFDSGTGWPSFDKPLDNAIVYEHDDSYGMSRIEIRCTQCRSHLGHVFDDGPTVTGKRYCLNSVCLDFIPKTDA